MRIIEEMKIKIKIKMKIPVIIQGVEGKIIRGYF